jgi:dihydropteroate synthase
MQLNCRGHILDLRKRPAVMGILNLTPDSFYDGGRYLRPADAVARARTMVEDGADIIDVGGESTRPGAVAVDIGEETQRILPVVERLVSEVDVPISIDTRKAEVAGTMLKAGAHMINDISGLSHDEKMADVAASYEVPVVIMHMRGTPQDMQEHACYDDVMVEVKSELFGRIEKAKAAGIGAGKIIVDPGIGFSKTASQSAELIARIDELVETGYPVLVGPSRKSFIGSLLGLKPERRLEASIASCLWAVLKGVKILRVHDVGPVVRSVRMMGEFTLRAKREEPKA